MRKNYEKWLLVFLFSLLSCVIFLAGCKNTVDGGVGGRNDANRCIATYIDPKTGKENKILSSEFGDQKNIPFSKIKDKLPTPNFGDKGYENGDGKVFAGWSTDGSTVVDGNANVAEKELKPVYDTAVVFELREYFNGSDKTLGKYKVAKSKIPNGGIEFDIIENKILNGKSISKPDCDFHWTTTKNDINTTIKQESKYSESKTFYTLYDCYPTAQKHKSEIKPTDLSGTEWMKKDSATGRYRYLIFTKELLGEWYILAYGESNNSLDEAKKKADSIVAYYNEKKELFLDFKDKTKYSGSWCIGSCGKNGKIDKNVKDEIVVSLSLEIVNFWMSESGKIIAKRNGNNGNIISTDDMYKQQK